MSTEQSLLHLESLLALLAEARESVSYQMGMQNLNHEAGRRHAAVFEERIRRIDAALACHAQREPDGRPDVLSASDLSDGAAVCSKAERASVQTKQPVNPVGADWIEHGPRRPCPFNPYLKVDIRRRDGAERLGDLACNHIWFWYEHSHSDRDIVAYRASQSTPSE
ncbi:hypothetical protein [Stutzerimonas stutzeri]|uniref:hypothetical protein n=1 Tax=Stutzerimonas stutzeri TaxID=316 RepID=UPI00265C93F6|nr:hypothetical protein [Stutzerimonas stutzeri]MCF6783369.1 hypothetical protein [Stutzerimonas stutzeri]